MLFSPLEIWKKKNKRKTLSYLFTYNLFKWIKISKFFKIGEDLNNKIIFCFQNVAIFFQVFTIVFKFKTRIFQLKCKFKSKISKHRKKYRMYFNSIVTMHVKKIYTKLDEK